MSDKSKSTGFVIMAQTGAMRRKIERVERAALELEQAVNDLNFCQVGIKALQPNGEAE